MPRHALVRLHLMELLLITPPQVFSTLLCLRYRRCPTHFGALLGSLPIICSGQLLLRRQTWALFEIMISPYFQYFHENQLFYQLFYIAYPTINPCTQTCCILNYICTHWGKALVCESSKKAHLMIGPWSDCVKKEVPWNPSVTISHNQIIISAGRKNSVKPSLCTTAGPHTP